MCFQQNPCDVEFVVAFGNPSDLVSVDPVVYILCKRICVKEYVALHVNLHMNLQFVNSVRVDTAGDHSERT